MKPIEEMTGLELREACAIEVCALTIQYVENEYVRCWEGDGTWCKDWFDGLVIERPGVGVRNEVPHYEDDPIAALLVVSAMTQRGYTFHHEQWPDYENWGAAFTKNRQEPKYVRESRFPRAICIAALKAVRAK